MATFRVYSKYPESKVLFLAPLRAISRERFNDWKEKMSIGGLKHVCELTGDPQND